MKHIGKNIRQLRHKNGWNQGEVARKLNISIPAFSKIETGITDINISRLNQVADLFGVPIEDILSVESEHLHPEKQEELNVLKTKLTDREDEIIKLQKILIELYEEIRKK